MTLAETWNAAIARATHLDPARITAELYATADTGIRAASYDRTGGRTSRMPCDEPERCDDGPGPHSHVVTNDPTGNAVGRLRGTEGPLRAIQQANNDFIRHGNVVLDYCVGETRTTWVGVVHRAQQMNPYTVDAGISVDHDRILPRAITAVDHAVGIVAAIARNHMPRTPTEDERHWTAGLADEDCCAWHLAIHRRYRRPRITGTNICQACQQLTMLGGCRPPRWLLEAEVDRGSKPRMWNQALSRWLDELAVPSHRRVG